MIISSWNVRGMNDPLKQQEVLEFLKRNRVDCGALIETHIKVDVARVIHKRKFSSYAMESNYSNHSGGRIWVIWNPAVAHVQVLARGAQFIHCTLLHLATQIKIAITFVYAFNRAQERMGLWDSLQQLSATQTLPWICLGDFNVSLSVDERVGCMVHDRDMQDFRDCLSFCSLVDHPYTGGIYTWHNKQAASPKWAKLDRLLIVLLDILMLGTLPVFHHVVSEGWHSAGSGGGIYSLFSKLRCIRGGLKTIHSSEFAGLRTRVSAAKQALTDCQNLLQLSPLNHLLIAQEKTALLQYVTLKKAEMRVLAQRAKIHHLQRKR
ncbi:uncharacterized protein LOC141587959 [Silene latifolia]|uniref:uncharacterized protein LOC141587959 n=1 Tax=Silene latifolia TaxID=37657 RepID=UPI003D78837B